jgi:hypothetical protein
MLFLDDAEVKKLADAMPDYRVVILTAAFAGLRASELSTPCPALCPGRVSPVVFPLAGPLPSTASAAPP